MRLRAVGARHLASLTPPWIALVKAGRDRTLENAPPPEHEAVLILKCSDAEVTCASEQRDAPVTENRAAFDARYTGRVLLATPAVPALKDPDAVLEAQHVFGFGWFIPELLKHRSIWRDVLAASLAIQLMALATPVFTQILIDKVIVHHTHSTLAVIAIALVMFALFTAGLTWVRQYLVLHTGNRIDAVLGSQVFEHLLRLPYTYFERRPTGTLVARLQAVESIREFLAGAAVTLILDVPFLLIFLAVMFYYSWPLTLITVSALIVIVALSLAVTPLLRERINNQFLLGARNQAFVTEYGSVPCVVETGVAVPRVNPRESGLLMTLNSRIGEPP
jgi:subfamily B ATP-binding cassette protein HlyB/CyaB